MKHDVKIVAVPHVPDGETLSLPHVVGAILDSDQFDDWIPDPAYFEDKRKSLERTIAAIDELRRQQRIPRPPAHVVELPRRTGKSSPALVLSFEIRALLHSVIAALAPRILRSLPRDKVYGFAFQPRDAAPFDVHSAELSQLIEMVSEASEERPLAGILDVTEFQANARLEKLAATLRACGASEEECTFVRDLLEVAGASLPSVDDALAFLYNFYLQPIDAELMKAKKNFFRYRDEYFIFEDETREALKKRLRTDGLIARAVARLTQRRREPRDAAESEELSFISRLMAGPPASLAELLRLDVDEQPLDAMEIAPHLRAAHVQRSAGALALPPFAGEREPLMRYRKQIGGGRRWLRRALTTALRDRSSWQATWAAMLLSDAGMLEENETALLLEVIGTPEMDDLSKLQARITLARCSNAPAGAFWAAPPEETPTAHVRRASLVGARFLAARREAADLSHWNELRARFAHSETLLIEHLTHNVRSAAP